MRLFTGNFLLYIRKFRKFRLQFARYETVAYALLNHGADVKIKDEHLGFTPLHYAILGGKLEVVNLLIEKGADVW